MKKPIFAIALAALLAWHAPACQARDLLCNFQARGLSISFGNLNPSSGSNVVVAVSAATVNAKMAGDCHRFVTMTIDGDGGQNFSGSRRLRNAAGTDFIAYSLVGLPISTAGPGNNSYVGFTFNGSIAWSAYANARAGSYTDTVMISVTP